MTKTIIFYHGNCPDGFGGAYAAWKKFGDTAEYIPLHRGDTPPVEQSKGNEVYFVDFVYDKPTMDEFAKHASRLVALDHHEGVRDVTESMPEFVYDQSRSGASIAWSYFHPETPLPTLLARIEDGDLFRMVDTDTRGLLSYIYAQPFTFTSWEKLHAELEDTEGKQKAIDIGKTYRAYFSILANQIADSAELVEFEGHTVYLMSATRAFISEVGKLLYTKQPPFALLPSVRPDGIRVSLRGNGSVNLIEIAKKYGGNGHHDSAAFSLSFTDPIPWKPAHENPRN